MLHIMYLPTYFLFGIERVVMPSAVWYGGMKNTKKKEENTGIGKKPSGQTDDWRTLELEELVFGMQEQKEHWKKLELMGNLFAWTRCGFHS